MVTTEVVCACAMLDSWKTWPLLISSIGNSDKVVDNTAKTLLPFMFEWGRIQDCWTNPPGHGDLETSKEDPHTYGMESWGLPISGHKS